MRRLLGVLRDDEPGRAARRRRGSPTLRDAGRPVRERRPAGRAARRRRRPTPLPPGVDLTAYRIVQEALTNVLKHAGAGADARVVRPLRAGRRSRSRSSTTAPAAGRRRAGAGGHGLIGMRERAAVYGGELVAAGPGRGGGFARAAPGCLEARASA